VTDATYMFGKEVHDAIDPQLYRITALYGSVEVINARPGFVRTIHRDGDGRVTRDVTNHYVCTSIGGDHCIYCGREMSK